MRPNHDALDPSVTPEEWLEANGQLDAAQAAARRIKAYLFVDRFLQYSKETTLLDVVHRVKAAAQGRIPKEVVSLSVNSYDNWPDNKGPTGWVVVKRVLEAHNVAFVIEDQDT